jgi:hypothetical protein
VKNKRYVPFYRVLTTRLFDDEVGIPRFVVGIGCFAHQITVNKTSVIESVAGAQNGRKSEVAETMAVMHSKQCVPMVSFYYRTQLPIE